MKTLQLIIIGAQKAGTSSLIQYLAQHPQLCTHTRPELNYFIDNTEFNHGFAQAYSRYFSCAEGTIAIGKSVGIMYSKEALQRVYAHNPNIQLVIILRNPIDRAYSAYWFARRRGWEDIKDFKEALFADNGRFDDLWIHKRECAYLDRSNYITHLETIYSIFNPKQVHIFQFETLQADVSAICQQLYRELGVYESFTPDTTRKFNKSAAARSPLFAKLMSTNRPLKWLFRTLLPNKTTDRLKQTLQKLNEKEMKTPPLAPEIRAEMIRYFKPYNEQLARTIGQDLSHWNI